VRRGYTDKDTVVWADGREKLVGRDWRKRKKELAERSKGQCEAMHEIIGMPPERCRRNARDPHHRIRRSVLRDDRLSNLENLCGPCHDALDDRKVRWTKR